MRGYDLYLEHQFRHSGSFVALLFQAIEHADEENLDRLAKGFPEEVEAYKTWSRVGQEAFLEGCDPSHPLVRGIRSGDLMV